jgi:hypothetical protein
MTKEGSSSSRIVVEGACLAFLTRVDTRHDSHSLSLLFRLFIATHKSTNGLEDLFLLVSFHQISLTPPFPLLSSQMLVHSSIITAESRKTIKRIFYYCSCLFYERPKNHYFLFNGSASRSGDGFFFIPTGYRMIFTAVCSPTLEIRPQ